MLSDLAQPNKIISLEGFTSLHFRMKIQRSVLLSIFGKWFFEYTIHLKDNIFFSVQLFTFSTELYFLIFRIYFRLNQKQRCYTKKVLEQVRCLNKYMSKYTVTNELNNLMATQSSNRLIQNPWSHLDSSFPLILMCNISENLFGSLSKYTQVPITSVSTPSLW